MTMKKIYGVTVNVVQSYQTYIYADSTEEAQEIAEEIYSHDSDALVTEWGSEELSHDIVANEQPYSEEQNLADYRGDGHKIAVENMTAHQEATESDPLLHTFEYARTESKHNDADTIANSTVSDGVTALCGKCGETMSAHN